MGLKKGVFKKYKVEAKIKSKRKVKKFKRKFKLKLNLQAKPSLRIYMIHHPLPLLAKVTKKTTN